MPRNADRPRWSATLLLSVLAVAGTGGAYVVLFPDHTDYAGHFLAGAGGTYCLLAVLVGAGVARRSVVVVAVLVAVLLGVLTEATIFRLAEFDPVDLANQSLGAVLAGTGMLRISRYDKSAGVAVVAGAVCLILGFRYAFA